MREGLVVQSSVHERKSHRERIITPRQQSSWLAKAKRRYYTYMFINEKNAPYAETVSLVQVVLDARRHVLHLLSGGLEHRALVLQLQLQRGDARVQGAHLAAQRGGALSGGDEAQVGLAGVLHGRLQQPVALTHAVLVGEREGRLAERWEKNLSFLLSLHIQQQIGTLGGLKYVPGTG